MRQVHILTYEDADGAAVIGVYAQEEDAKSAARKEAIATVGVNEREWVSVEQDGHTREVWTECDKSPSCWWAVESWNVTGS